MKQRPGPKARGRGRPTLDPSGPASELKIMLSPADRVRLERLRRRLRLPSLSATHRAAVERTLRDELRKRRKTS